MGMVAMFEIVNGRTSTDGRRKMGILCEPEGSDELKIRNMTMF